MGCAFFALPRSEKLRWPGAWRVHCPMWAMHLIHLPGSSRSVSQVCHESTVPGVLCVSSGDLISGCDTYGRYQLSRIPGRRGEQLGACSVWWKMPSLRPRFQQPLAFRLWLSAFPPLCREGPIWLYDSQLALLWYSLNPVVCECARVHRAILEPFLVKVSFLSLSLSFSLSDDPVDWVAVSH